MNTKTTYKDETIHPMRGKFVVHFLAFQKPDHEKNGLDAISMAYAAAVAWANGRGAKRFHNKSFGGGIAFPSLQAAWDAIDASPLNK